MRNTLAIATMLACSGLGLSSLCALETPLVTQGGKLDWPTEVLQHQLPGKQEAAVVTQLAIHPTAPLAAVVGDDHIVSLVNLDSGLLEKTLKGHSDWIRAAQFTPDGSQLLTAGVDRKILAWDLKRFQWELFATLPSSIEDITISPDGKWLAAVGFDANLRVYRLDNGQLAYTTPCPCADMRCVQFSPSGEMLAAAGRCGSLRIWVKDADRWVAMEQDIPAHRQRVRSLKFLNETTLLSCSEDRTIRKADLSTMQSSLLAETDGRKFDLEIIDGRTIACCGSTNQIELFDATTGGSLGHLEGHKGTVSCIEYHEGKLLSGSFDTDARLWKTRQEVSAPLGNPDHTAAFDLPAIQRSASSGSLSPPPTFK